MPQVQAMFVMSAAEFVLWTALAVLVWAKGLQRRFPATGAYLALHVVSTAVLSLVQFGETQHWLNDYCDVVYFFGFWAVYIASAVLLFFVCIEIFRSVLSAISGLMKFGLVVFRWAALASVVVSFATVPFSHRGILIIPDIAYGLMRSVSIVELCLLAFLCLCMNGLCLSVRDRAFGIALGLGLMAANDFVHSLLVSTFTTLTAPAQFFYEGAVLFGLAVWAVYFALPERARMPVMLPVNSTIYRWNEIASALGHAGTQVAVQQPAGSFFLTDVEMVVEKVLTRTLKEHESKS